MKKLFNKYNLLLLLVTIVWGTTFFIVKDTVQEVDEYFIVATRNLIAAFLMLAYMMIKKPLLMLHRRSIFQGAALGIMLAVMYASQTIGLKYTSAGHSAFITSIAVIFVPVILFLFYGFSFKNKEITGFIIVTAGLFFLTYDFETAINIGDLITLVTAFTAGFHIVLSGRFVSKSHSLSLITWQFIFASVFSFMAFFISGNPAGDISTGSWISIIYLGAIGTLFCYFVSVWAQNYVSSINVALIFSLEPVFAAIFSFFALGEILNLIEISGAMLILAGIIYYQLPARFFNFIRK